MNNKSLIVNSIAALIIVLGHTVIPEPYAVHVTSMGYFGFSGAITNWLAIHMLFERVPGLYGSGIIPLKFESFKAAIRDLIMNQFFTIENIERFMRESATQKLDLAPVIEHLNYDKIFDGFVEVVQKSKFGGMLSMFGGAKALESMRPQFTETMKRKLNEIAHAPDFLEHLPEDLGPVQHQQWQDKIAAMVEARLAELTPKMVKDIIQEMIRSHLGWLVVWGGVFGGLIGLVSSLARTFLG